MKDTKHTPGPWSVGKYGNCVISDKVPEDYTPGSGHDATHYYGGFLIAESVRICDIPLISAAPDLLEALTCHEFQMCIMDWKILPSNSNGKIAFDKIQAAIAKATNTK